MRIGLRGLADLTNVNSMLLPELGPALPGPLQYEGGLSGLGQACGTGFETTGGGACVPSTTSTPASFSQMTAAEQAAALAASEAGAPIGTPFSQMTAAQQAAYLAAQDAATTGTATTSGNVCPAGSKTCTTVNCSPFGTFNTTTQACDYSTAIVIGGSAILLLFLVMVASGGRRR